MKLRRLYPTSGVVALEVGEIAMAMQSVLKDR
jgi:hypothetical protein